MPTIASIRLLRQLDVPAARNGTQGRHLFNAVNAGADQIGERVSVGDGFCAVAALISAKLLKRTTRRFMPEISAGRCAINRDPGQVPGFSFLWQNDLGRHGIKHDRQRTPHPGAAHRPA